jgi:hypothetical protein
MTLIRFLTSPTGIFAAVVAVVGLAATIYGVIRPQVVQRRTRREGRAKLAIFDLDLDDLAAWGSIREIRFKITNSGGASLVMTSLQVRVMEAFPSQTTRTTDVAAPVVVYRHRVALEPDSHVYDLLRRRFGPDSPPLSLTPGETVAYIVKLVSKKPYIYRLRVEADWFDTTRPDKPSHCHTDTLTADFPAES